MNKERLTTRCADLMLVRIYKDGKVADTFYLQIGETQLPSFNAKNEVQLISNSRESIMAYCQENCGKRDKLGSMCMIRGE